MTWSPTIRRAPEALPVHLERLAEQFGDLTAEIRSSIAGVAGNAIGQAVRDVLLRFWSRPTESSRQPSHPDHDPYGWPTDEWDRHPDPWDDTESPAELPTPSPSRLSLALQAGGWLLQHASVLGLFGVGAAVGGVLLFRGSLGVPGIDLINSVAEVAALIALLSSASRQLLLN